MKKFSALLMIVVLSLSLTACKSEKVTKQSFAFDTVVTITADKKYEKEISEALSMCGDYELVFSRTNEKSELYKVNSGEKNDLSPDLEKAVEASLLFSSLTDGAFDITVSPLIDLWDVKNRTTPPSQEEIEKALQNVGYKNVKSAPFSRDDKILDMGAIAKGYIANKLVEYFKEKGAKDVIIDLGGNVALIGEHTVGIRNPQNPDEIFAVIKAKDKSVVTSGAYQRYFDYNEKRYHHIIDPKTGFPADNNILSVTVVSPSSMIADALSTSIYIMGESALSLCEEFEDTDAIIIRKDMSTITTDGFFLKYSLEYN